MNLPKRYCRSNRRLRHTRLDKRPDRRFRYNRPPLHSVSALREIADDTPLKLYYLRHGQSTYNVLGLCNDDPADPAHLTPLGEQQAQRAAEQLRDVALDRIFVSELPRTQQTAAIVNQYHRVPVDVRAALNDIRSGFNNRPVAEYFAATAHDELHARVNGGESLLDHRARVRGFIEWLASQPDNAVLVVAHEETLRVFEAYFTKLPDAELRSLHFVNCGVIAREL
jgi:alpha-ribazole phosphatase